MDSQLHRTALLCCVLAVVASGSEAARRETRVFPGPVEARVLRVLDGDTFLAEAHLWPGQDLRINVRIRGIDAPEMKSRCETERVMARQAREMLEGLVDDRPVLISNIAAPNITAVSLPTCTVRRARRSVPPCCRLNSCALMPVAGARAGAADPAWDRRGCAAPEQLTVGKARPAVGKVKDR